MSGLAKRAQPSQAAWHNIMIIRYIANKRHADGSIIQPFHGSSTAASGGETRRRASGIMRVLMPRVSEWEWKLGDRLHLATVHRNYFSSLMPEKMNAPPQMTTAIPPFNEPSPGLTRPPHAASSFTAAIIHTGRSASSHSHAP